MATIYLPYKGQPDWDDELNAAVNAINFELESGRLSAASMSSYIGNVTNDKIAAIRGVNGGVAGIDAFGNVTDASGNVITPRNIIDLSSVIAVSPRFTGIYRNNTALNSRAGLQAAIDATPDGGTLVIPPGEYLVTGALTNVTAGVVQGINIVARGVKIWQGSNTFPVDFVGSVDEAIPLVVPTTGDPPVTVIAPDAREEITQYGGNEDAQVLTFTLTTAPPSAWRLGDRVRLVSDDVLPGARLETGNSQRRMGADFLVLEQTGTQVKVIGMRNAYDGNFSTNVRIVRYGDKRVTWSGGTFDVADSVLVPGTTRSVGYMRFTGLNYPVIEDVVFLRSASVIVMSKGNYAPRISNISTNFALNNASEGSQLGYLLLDVASSYGMYDRMFGAMLRHVYTDDSAAVLGGFVTSAEIVAGYIAAGGSNTALNYYSSFGSTRGAHITNSIGVATISTAFSPHSQSRSVTFENCHAYDCSGGFAARGKDHTYRNVSWTNCYRGFTVFSENGTATAASNMVLDGFRGRNTIDCDIRFMKNYLVNPTPDYGVTTNTRVTAPDKVMNGVIEATSGNAFWIRNSSVYISNVAIFAGSSLTTNGQIIEQDNSTVRVGGPITFNMYSVTSGSNVRLIHTGATGGDSGSWKGGKIQVFGSSSQIARLASIASGSSSHQFQTDLYTETPLTSSRLHGSRGPNSLVRFNMGDGGSSAYFTGADAFIADATQGEYLQTLDEPRITLAIEATTAGQNLHKLLAPNRSGQFMDIVNVGTQSFTVKHGSSVYGTNLTGGADQVVAPGGILKLRWDARSGVLNWRQYT